MIVKPAAQFASSAFRTAITVGAVAVLLPTASFAASEPLRPLTAAEIKAGPQKGVVRALLRDVVPHTRETGHNAADREMRAAIEAARAAVRN